MSESAPPPVPAGPAGGDEGPLTAAAVEALLADFRAWLTQPAPPAVPPPPAPVDWDAIVGGWTALRHEIHLQTRASRAQLEQNAQAIEALRGAAMRPHEAPTDDEAVRPLLKTLVDVYDALALAHREVQRALDYLPPVAGPPDVVIGLPAWARWLGLGTAVERGLAPLRAWQKAPPADAAREKVDALLVGYQMSLQRVDRALGQHGLEPIPAVGRPFDPERMEVVEVVRDPGRAGAEVLDEVRRGYLWRGRVFRFAQVRVGRP